MGAFKMTPNSQYTKTRQQFKRWRAHNELSLKAAEKLTRVNYRTLLRFEEGNEEVMARTFLKLAAFLERQVK
jgi:transcriptional regulator with XRE-family HTH domain